MSQAENNQAREAWNTNASFWDHQMVDGNDFFNQLVWSGVEGLLRPEAGELLLDVACGSGVTCRRLSRMGAKVVAIDFGPSRQAVPRHPVAAARGSFGALCRSISIDDERRGH